MPVYGTSEVCGGQQRSEDQRGYQPPEQYTNPGTIRNCRFFRRFTNCTKNLHSQRSAKVKGDQKLKEYHQLSILKILAPSANCRFLADFQTAYQIWASLEVSRGQKN